jgi:hypothetical protein
MKNEDKRAFFDLMMAAGEVYGREVTQPMAAIYFSAMATVSIEQVQAAMMAHMQNPDSGRFFPKPADLIKQMTGTTKQQDAAIEDRAAIAWACIERDIRRIGSYGTLKLEDKQALATVKAMGGWQSICQTETSKMEWKRKEFIRMYETFERMPLEALPSSLPGRIEMSEVKQAGPVAMDKLALGVTKWRESNGQ